MSRQGRLVIGVGNAFRGDDGAGPAVAERLADSGIAVVAHHGEGLELIELWREADDVVLVDAVASGAPPGRVHVIEVAEGHLPAEMGWFSSHLFGPAQAVAMAAALGRLPRRLRVVGIEAATFTPGAALSPPVAEAVGTTVALVREWFGDEE